MCRSRTGDGATLAGCALRSWSGQQGAVSLWRDVADDLTCVEGATEMIQLRSPAKDLKWNGLQQEATL